MGRMIRNRGVWRGAAWIASLLLLVGCAGGGSAAWPRDGCGRGEVCHGNHHHHNARHHHGGHDGAAAELDTEAARRAQE